MLLENGKILNKGNNDSNLSARVLYNLITFQAGLTLFSLLSLTTHPHLPDTTITYNCGSSVSISLWEFRNKHFHNDYPIKVKNEKSKNSNFVTDIKRSSREFRQKNYTAVSNFSLKFTTQFENFFMTRTLKLGAHPRRPHSRIATGGWGGELILDQTGMCHQHLKFITLFWSGKTQKGYPALELLLLP